MKFIEEGLCKLPEFEVFILRNNCGGTAPTSQVKDVQSHYLPRNKICEIISIQNDTLCISGTSQDYTIVYLKMGNI